MNLVLETKDQKDGTVKCGNGMVMMTPPIDENYWLFRVAVSEKQAVVGFEKFGLIGIGFQHEEDWNTNLPSSQPAETIYGHIEHNRLDADRERCIEAIRMIQAAARERKAGGVK